VTRSKPSPTFPSRSSKFAFSNCHGESDSHGRSELLRRRDHAVEKADTIELFRCQRQLDEMNRQISGVIWQTEFDRQIDKLVFEIGVLGLPDPTHNSLVRRLQVMVQWKKRFIANTAPSNLKPTSGREECEWQRQSRLDLAIALPQHSIRTRSLWVNGGR
jgi:hypothetical protein